MLKVKNKLITTLLILLCVLAIQGLSFTYKKIINEKDKNITELNNTIFVLNTKIIDDYIPLQIEYEDTLQRITKYINTTDSFLNIGGSSTPEYFDSIIFEEILNAEGQEDFTGFLTNVELYFDKRSQYFNDIPYIWPLEYSPLIKITSTFGERFSPFTGTLQRHEGIDMISTFKARIFSTAPGRVIECWKNHPTLGMYVIIDHGNGYKTYYAHMSELYIKYTDKILRGQTIGRMGNTGESSGMHLHYGISFTNKETGKDEWIDPINFLRDTIDSKNVRFENND